LSLHHGTSVHRVECNNNVLPQMKLEFSGVDLSDIIEDGGKGLEGLAPEEIAAPGKNFWIVLKASFKEGFGALGAKNRPVNRRERLT